MSSRLNELSLAGIKFLGYSQAGEETVLAAPELNVCFDVGRAPRQIISIDHVLLTHGHMDHAAGLAYYFSQRAFVGNSPGIMLMPRPLVPWANAIMQAWAGMEGHPSPANIIGLEPGQDYTLRRGVIVRSFAVHHGSPALGYSLIEVRRKLKPELLGKPQHQIVALKRQGAEIEYTLEVPLIAFCGDTAVGDFFDLPYVRSARVLVLECTFFEPQHIRRARAGHHLHINDLASLLDRLDNQAILMTHLTRRTTIRQARKILQRLVGRQAAQTIHFLMERPRVPSAPAEQPSKADCSSHTPNRPSNQN
ncbi:MAG: MBL fold metallo-hydrolase [Phycisphaerae bacterium]